MGQRGMPHRLEDHSSLLQTTTPKPIYAGVSVDETAFLPASSYVAIREKIPPFHRIFEQYSLARKYGVRAYRSDGGPIARSDAERK